MHTFKADRRTTFHHNNSTHPNGPVHIVIPDGTRIEVPMGDLLDFVANVVMSERISQLEQAGTEEILGIRGLPRG